MTDSQQFLRSVEHTNSSWVWIFKPATNSKKKEKLWLTFLSFKIVPQPHFSSLIQSTAFESSMKPRARIQTKNCCWYVWRWWNGEQQRSETFLRGKLFCVGWEKSKENDTSHLLNLLRYVQRVPCQLFCESEECCRKIVVYPIPCFRSFSRTNTLEGLFMNGWDECKEARLTWWQTNKKPKILFRLSQYARRTFSLLEDEQWENFQGLFTFVIFKVVKRGKVCALVFVQFSIDLIITTRCFNYAQHSEFGRKSLTSLNMHIPMSCDWTNFFSLIPENLFPLAKIFSIFPVWKSCA